MKTHVLRLEPGDDLKEGLAEFLSHRKIEAAAMMTCVGSLDRLSIRLAGAPGPSTWEGDYEILSLEGTLSRHGMHLHLCAADAKGAPIGGHLDFGCQIRTTAEIVLCELPGMVFLRVLDENTGHRELEVRYL